MENSNQPIFIVGLTWRNGTTALQRILNASGEVLIWGEPWSNTHRLQNLYHAYLELPDESVSPHPLQNNDFDLSSTWTALLSPSRVDFAKATKDFYREFFGAEAQRRGIMRWGFKEVHLDGSGVNWLSMLFPESSFLFIHRNPIDSWKSYMNSHRGYGRGWRQPEYAEPIVTMDRYAKHWRDRAQSLKDFAEVHRDNVLEIPYESLLSDSRTVISSAFKHCGISASAVDKGVLAAEKFVGGRSNRKDSYPVREEDKRVLTELCSEQAQRLGYRLNEL